MNITLPELLLWILNLVIFLFKALIIGIIIVGIVEIGTLILKIYKKEKKRKDE